jgi:two-component system cell cycle sensor histidine kinase/response regulator CckA
VVRRSPSVTADTEHQLRDAKAALRESEARHRLLLDYAALGIGYYDLEGRCQLMNRIACEAMNTTEDQLIGRHAVELFGEDMGQRILDRIAQALRTDRPLSFEDEAKLATGARWYDSTYALIRDGGTPIGVQVISREITAEKQAEALTEQLQAAQRLESIGRLAGGVAHDFNNALCVVLGNAELGTEELPHGDPRQVYFDNITEAAERAAKVTRQLLAFSRQQLIEPVAVDVYALLDGLQSMLSRLLGEDLQIAIEVAQGCGRAYVDPSQLEQIVVNLALNARDAMPRGGKLRFAVADIDIGVADPATRDTETLRPPAPTDLALGRYILLSVSDTGDGIAPAVQGRIFEPFFTTKPQGKGTGLGLATVFGIVKQHRGALDVLSTPGEGATFRVFLPRAEPCAKGIGEVEVEPKRPGGSDTVLLVEDDDLVRRVTVGMLERLGYRVLAAASGADALELAQQTPQIDLLLSDVVMPRMNGPELAAKLREARPALRVLYTSGYSDEIRDERGALPPGVQLLPKPFTASTLATHLRVILDAPG